MIATNNENLHQLAEATYAVVLPGYEDLGNEGIIITADGVVVIDTDIRTYEGLFATLPELTDKPVRFVINTHHAFDHSSGNSFFADRGATIIGSEVCREE